MQRRSLRLLIISLLFILSTPLFAVTITTTSNASYLPNGNYIDSCSKCTVRHHRLKCLCQTERGDWRDSSIQIHPHCRYIQNFDGHLTCTFSPGTHLPGSFHKTCRHCHSNGFNLTCLCQRRDQSERRTSLHYADRCPWIVNHNGRLKCRQ